MINDSTHNWINNNKQRLRYYKRKYIAYTLADGIIAYNDTLEDLLIEAKKVKDHFTVYYVNPLMFKTRILPIHFRTVKTHDWEPVREFTLRNQENSLLLPMLVDSGADCSLISLRTGQSLGLQVLETDDIEEAFGIGESIEYIRKRILVTIEEYTIKIPVAWVQNPECQDEIIGREVIFDAFDIEFRQADETIEFKKREAVY